jgi:hypothetical protein
MRSEKGLKQKANSIRKRKTEGISLLLVIERFVRIFTGKFLKRKRKM